VVKFITEGITRILITGGAGFIGSHLADRFLSEGHHVIVMDNLVTGDPRNITHLMVNDHFKFVKHDVTNFIYVEGALDAVLHFASPASPVDYLRLPIQTLKVGALGTHNALGVAKVKGARFLLASTSEIYGDPLVHPQPEDYWGNVNPVGLRGVYDEAKRFAEAITMAYHRYHGVNTCIVRIFNTFGPRMRLEDGRAVPNFIMQCLQGKPITIFGDGSQTRSLVYISDEIEGIYRLLMAEGVHDPLNIGNPHEMTIKQLAELIRDLSGSNSEITYHPLPQDDPKVRQPDTSKAKTMLGWEPKVPVEEGLQRTIEDFRQRFVLR
jgi:dTDP-glucose 4,6-dehydratase